MSLSRNALWSLAGAAVPLIAGAALIPYLLSQLGVELFGVLTLVWVLMGYFSLFDFGLGRALTQKVSQRLSSGEHLAELPALIKCGVLLATALGGAGGVVLALGAAPFATEVMRVSPALRQDVLHALLVTAVGIPITTATVGLRGVLEAYEDFKNANVLRMLFGIGTFGLPAASVFFFGPSLLLMVSCLMLARLALVVAHWRLVSRCAPAAWWKSRFRRGEVRGLLSFGAWMSVSNIISPLMVTADRFVISAVLGAATVAYYAVPSELIARTLILPGALASVLFPRLASLLVKDTRAAHRLYKGSVSIVTTAMVPVSLALMLGSHWGLSLWLGSGFADEAAPVVTILAVGLALNGIAFIPFAVVQAAGLAHVTAKLHLIEALFYFPLLWYGLHAFGLKGAAVAWVGRVGIDLLLLLISTRRLVFPQEVTTPLSSATKASLLRPGIGS
ncbi:MAG: flippase [Pseudomonadota bacterium]